MVLAIIICITHYLVIYSFNHPIGVAINSTFWNILKIIFFLKLAAGYMNIKFTDLFPIKSLLGLLIHSLTIILLVKLILYYFYLSIFYELCLAGILFPIFLLFTGKIFHNDYLSIIKPILYKILNKV
tara:strand:- start:288 stop:668 length:381 start_codon:yes stop_codon:yes gene_type:complete